MNEKCENCGKASGGVCGACHCGNDLARWGNNLYRLLTFAAPSFCAKHCGEQHREVCKEMQAAIATTKGDGHER